MNITKRKLKQIILEELDRLEEVSNEEVQIATMQAVAQGEAVNNSTDAEIMQQVHMAVKALAHLVSGVSDGSMQGALMGPLNSFQEAISAIEADINDISRDDRPNTTPNQWGESETAPE
jgi:hypothetical protein